jgi:plasmid maintenance system antidote protein VapI
MSKPKDPGDIPEWSETFLALTAEEKRKIAHYIGVTVRTVQKWASGTKPSPMAAKKIPAAFRRMGGAA